MTHEAIDTCTGEIREAATDLDAKISELYYLKATEQQIRDQRMALEDELAVIASSIGGEGKTRRVAGKRWVAKVTFKQYEKWQIPQLEELRAQVGDPTFFRYFRIGEYKPNAKELQKLKNTAGEPEALYRAFAKALDITEGKPSVTIEEGPEAAQS